MVGVGPFALSTITLAFFFSVKVSKSCILGKIILDLSGSFLPDFSFYYSFLFIFFHFYSFRMSWHHVMSSWHDLSWLWCHIMQSWSFLLLPHVFWPSLSVSSKNINIDVNEMTLSCHVMSCCCHPTMSIMPSLPIKVM